MVIYISVGTVIDKMKANRRIAAGVISFDDERGLQRCMNFINEYVDLMIVIDGKFRYFEDDHEISSDNSRDVVESFSNSAYCCYPNLTEIEKRNKYLEFAGDKNMDFLLVIDSDEFAVVNEVDFLFNLDKLRNSKINSGRCDGDNPDVMESRFLRSISKNQISLERDT